MRSRVSFLFVGGALANAMEKPPLKVVVRGSEWRLRSAAVRCQCIVE